MEVMVVSYEKKSCGMRSWRDAVLSTWRDVLSPNSCPLQAGENSKTSKNNTHLAGVGGVKGSKLKSHDQTGKKQSKKDCLFYCF
jgi:hypothetical protein